MNIKQDRVLNTEEHKVSRVWIENKRVYWILRNIKCQEYEYKTGQGTEYWGT